jgi:hypothetical protein
VREDGLVSYSGHLVESYLARTGQPRAGQRDAHYSYQWTVLRDMLARLEVILDDEDVPRETAERVIRCLLYGAPSAADADERMEQHAEMVNLMARVPPSPMFFPGAADLGLPPR